MRTGRQLLALLAASVLVSSLLVAAEGAASAAPASPASSATAAQASRSAGATTLADARKKRYEVNAGVVFNNPLGSRREKRAINNKILRAIRHSGKNSKIRIASWNIRSNEAIKALINANKRGASVQVIMDWGNGNRSNPNRGFDRLHRALKRHPHKNKRHSLRSWTKKCHSSCRGHRGLAHTKMYIFSHTGASRWVVMWGSNNLTDTAAGYQWNDLFTVKKRKMYLYAVKVFHQMRRDRAMKNPFRSATYGRARLDFMPYYGKHTPGDPWMHVLNQIRCHGAQGKHGINGRTSIRIAQDAIAGKRGIKLATRLRWLWDHGCDVRMIYTQIGKRILKIFRDPGGRGPLPFRQVVQDWNGDWVYDRYLHSKSLALSGHYGDDRQAEYTWNGSSNWVPRNLTSDDTLGRISGWKVRRQYAHFVNRWYFHAPTSAAVSARVARMAAANGIDPYAKVKQDY